MTFNNDNHDDICFVLRPMWFVLSALVLMMFILCFFFHHVLLSSLSVHNNKNQQQQHTTEQQCKNEKWSINEASEGVRGFPRARRRQLLEAIPECCDGKEDHSSASVPPAEETDRRRMCVHSVVATIRETPPYLPEVMVMKAAEQAVASTDSQPKDQRQLSSLCCSVATADALTAVPVTESGNNEFGATSLTIRNKQHHSHLLIWNDERRQMKHATPLSDSSKAEKSNEVKEKQYRSRSNTNKAGLNDKVHMGKFDSQQMRLRSSTMDTGFLGNVLVTKMIPAENNVLPEGKKKRNRTTTSVRKQQDRNIGQSVRGQASTSGKPCSHRRFKQQRGREKGNKRNPGESYNILNGGRSLYDRMERSKHSSKLPPSSESILQLQPMSKYGRSGDVSSTILTKFHQYHHHSVQNSLYRQNDQQNQASLEVSSRLSSTTGETAPSSESFFSAPPSTMVIMPNFPAHGTCSTLQQVFDINGSFLGEFALHDKVEKELSELSGQVAERILDS